MLVDSDTSGHLFNDPLVSKLQYKLDKYQVLDAPSKITTTECHNLDGIARGSPPPRDHKYVSEISGQHIEWMETWLLKPKGDALDTFQSFAQYKVTPRGFRIGRSRAAKGGEYIKKGYKDYCLETEVSLDYARTNTPHKTGISERIERALAGLCKSMLADSRLPHFPWGRTIFTENNLHGRVSGQQGAVLP